MWKQNKMADQQETSNVNEAGVTEYEEKYEGNESQEAALEGETEAENDNSNNNNNNDDQESNTVEQANNENNSQNGDNETSLNEVNYKEDNADNSANNGGDEDQEELEPLQYRKLFIGSLNYITTEEAMRNYFSQYGDILDCVIMKEPKSNK